VLTDIIYKTVSGKYDTVVAPTPTMSDITTGNELRLQTGLVGGQNSKKAGNPSQFLLQ